MEDVIRQKVKSSPPPLLSWARARSTKAEWETEWEGELNKRRRNEMQSEREEGMTHDEFGGEIHVGLRGRSSRRQIEDGRRDRIK